MDQNISQTENHIQTVCLLILAFIGIAFALIWLRPVMIPFVLSFVFFFILTPIIDAQRVYLKFPRPLAIVISLAFGCLLIFLLWLLISASVNQITANIGQYEDKLQQLFINGTDKLHLERFGLDAKNVVSNTLKKFSGQAGTYVLNTFNTVIGLFSKGILILIFTAFLILGKPKQPRPQSTWAEIESRIKLYLNTKFFISAITGLLVGLILSFLNIDLALVFGVLAFILNFIPSIGSIIATLLPLPVILVSPDVAPWQAVLAIVLPGAIQFSVGNIIEPKIMGDSLDLHPITILMALIFWGMIWGIVGMLLAAPLTAIMKIIFEKIETTRPLANLLAGRI